MCGAQNSTVDIWLTLTDGRVQLLLYVTSGNVSLTSDPVLPPTYDLLNVDHNNDSFCSIYVDVKVGRNQVAMTGSVFSVNISFTFPSDANFNTWFKMRLEADFDRNSGNVIKSFSVCAELSYPLFSS